METSIAAFKNRVSRFNQRDQDRINAALSLVETRSPGLALEIASVILDINLDGDTVAAALLLDCADTPLAEQFGADTARLVEGVRKTGGIPARNKTIREAENIRKMLFAMADDIRVIFIKLAERLCTMRNLDRSPAAPTTGPEPTALPSAEPSAAPLAEPDPSAATQQKAVAQECLDVYAPLADRLGISWIKDELEDLALKRLNREAYNQIREIVSEKREERNEFLNRIQADLQREAAESGIPIEVSSRAKHFYSIYQKMRKRNKAAADLYDLFGIRILCGSIEHCYTLLGLVHRLWKPLEGRFKDYIAMPKSNGYQSLHTTDIVPPARDRERGAGTAGIAGERMLEIQIRTREMHHVAEFGVASHWLYKKGSTRELVRPVDISIVNRLRDWKTAGIPGVPPESGTTGPAGGAVDTPAEQNIRDSRTFLEELRREILRDSIYVFTPMGKVVELPAGATPLDFAYSIHSAVGSHCIGAKADGSIVPLSSELRNTQVVEILTSPQAHPHLNWLRIVKTSKARSKIRAWLEQNDDSLIIEKNVVARKKPAPGPEKPAEKPGETPPSREAPQRIIRQNDQSLQVRVEDEKNMMIRFARCCRPVTGDPIIGYISRGRGIIIHRRDCGNLANIPDFEERKIEAEWENALSVLVKRFKIEAKLRTNLFSEIEGAVRKYQGHLIEGRLEETTANRLTGFFTMQLEYPDSLRRLIKNIRGIPGVHSIRELSQNEARHAD
ncbi:MAG: HD domain-containing protein [Treponema sp.]|jgi:GTP pyrophosphokinase|nr:HD domain-containing protein [Treponema sp.]